MRRIWPLFAVPIAAIAVVSLVGVLRRDSVGPTPGEVVEKFLDRIVGERYDRAAVYLAAGSGTPPEGGLKDWKENVESGLGKIRDVRGETDWISGEEAEATGILVAERRERRLRFTLERDRGRWRIARLDEFWGEEPAPESGILPSLRIREGGRPRAHARPASHR